MRKVGSDEPGPRVRADFDRKLVDLISELADCGMVWNLVDAVHIWGRDRAVRVISDGFAVIRNRRDAERDRGLDDATFLPTEEALVLLHHLRKRDDYVISEGPWAALGPEDEPNLIFDYAADDPKALAEVKRRHAERRARWEQKLASA